EATSVPNAPYCSSTRLQVPVTVAQLLDPIVFGDSVLCGNAATLSCIGSNHLFNWYTQAVGGNPFTNDSTIYVSDLSTTIYYVEATSNINPVGNIQFNYTGGQQSWTVPAGVTSIQVDMAGAQGGSNTY